MTKIAKQLTELVGNTPLLELNKYSQAKGLEIPVIAKVEFFNPGGSVKDRIALAMIESRAQTAPNSSSCQSNYKHPQTEDNTTTSTINKQTTTLQLWTRSINYFSEGLFASIIVKKIMISRLQRTTELSC